MKTRKSSGSSLAIPHSTPGTFTIAPMVTKGIAGSHSSSTRARSKGRTKKKSRSGKKTTELTLTFSEFEFEVYRRARLLANTLTKSVSRVLRAGPREVCLTIHWSPAWTLRGAELTITSSDSVKVWTRFQSRTSKLKV